MINSLIMKEKKYNIVYKTTNNINNKVYIGVHSTNNLNDRYIGNGVRVGMNLKNKKTNSTFISDIIKYGYKNFKREVLFNFKTRQEAVSKEEELVDMDFVMRSDVYNIVLGGNFGGEVFKFLPKNVQDKVSKKISESSKTNKNIIKNQFQNLSKEIRRKYQDKANSTVRAMEKHPNKGLVRTDIQKINNAKSRSKFIYIDPDGNEFETALEASIEHNISHKLVELRSRRGNLGWSRKEK